MIELASGDYALSIDPPCGGSVSALTWRGQPVLRTREGPGVLDSACFPLVPFCNRIAGSRFAFGGTEVTLAKNHPGNPDDLVLHGSGWTSEWTVDAVEPDRARIVYDHEPASWPWRFRAAQSFALDENGVTMELELTNRADTAMPAGLGFHPYFPSDSRTIYRGLHRGEWQADARVLPARLVEHPTPIDWWHGRPVTERVLDTVYTGREGTLRIAWPDRDLGVEIGSSPDLRFTHVYVPADGDFICVEPVSQIGDAFNHPDEDRGFRTLAPGESWTVAMSLRAYALSAP